ncbi:hypothetical protein, partial [Clostridium culturomicium]|uniref:hypothetical protein n=1 Tax=Clostridium culturomicium TaxID=1499683 RepID=UPI000591556A
MSVITLKKKLEAVSERLDKQKGYWKSVEYSREIQSNQLSKEIQEKVDCSTKEINKTVKEEAGRILFTPLKVRQV